MNIFIFKQKTANEMRNSDWRSDVCSSDLTQHDLDAHMAVSGRHRLVQQGVDVGAPLDDAADQGREELRIGVEVEALFGLTEAVALKLPQDEFGLLAVQVDLIERLDRREPRQPAPRSEEHTSELQSLMRISYAVFCLKKKKTRLQSDDI